MTKPHKRYISLLLPKWPIECMPSEYCSIETPLIQTVRSQNKIIIQALNGVAENIGLQPGMSLATARAISSNLTVTDYKPGHNQTCLDGFAGWATQFTPFVSCDGDDCLMMDVTGCPHLFGGEKSMLEVLSNMLDQLGHQHRLALADTPAASWALSHCASSALTIQEIRMKEVVENLPVEALRLSQGIITDLHRVGLRLIKDVLPIARASLASRYGMELATRLDQMLGHIAEPITPRPYEAPYSVRLPFPDAIGLTEDVVAALDRLINALSIKLSRKAMGARRLVLVVEKVDKTRQQIAIGTSEPTYNFSHIKRLFQEKISQIEPGFGIDAMRLIATATEGLKRDQLHMLAAQGEGGRDKTKLNVLVDCLTNRLGVNAVGRIRPKNSRLPDQVQGWSTAFGHDWPKTPPRPTLLLNRPHPLNLSTQPTTGKALKNFSYKGRAKQVAKAWGPERISPDWWRKDTNWANGVRDYYRVETNTGEQLWIYRESQSSAKQWFLHGHFA